MVRFAAQHSRWIFFNSPSQSRISCGVVKLTDKTNNTSIKSWPSDDRPREKLLKKGAASLSNSELLAILLRTGVKGVSAIDLARRIVDKFGTFRNMSHTDARDWKEFKGLGPAKIAQIQAALEIGRRFREVEVNNPRKKYLQPKKSSK